MTENNFTTLQTDRLDGLMLLDLPFITHGKGSRFQSIEN